MEIVGKWMELQNGVKKNNPESKRQILCVFINIYKNLDFKKEMTL
jgi:hypothetical protein